MPGKNLKNNANIKPRSIAKQSSIRSCFLPEKSRINIAKIPGDTKPVYSCNVLETLFAFAH